jgi:small subunit ribosomal protein S6
VANYELMLVVDPFLEDTEHQGMLEKATEQIKRRGGNITQVDPWGKRRLAYPINKKLEGYYALLSFEGTLEGAAIAEIERVLRLEEKVMRVMITRVPTIKPRKTKKGKGAEGEGRSAGDTMSAGQAGQQPSGR